MSDVKTGIPGFVDLQVNGFLGVDFSSAVLTEENCAQACRELLSRGTAAFFPTVITSPLEVYQRNLPLIAKMMEQHEFQGRLLGIHLEGPFICGEEGAVGAHNKEWVQKPSIELFDKLQEWAGGKVALLTIAAEIEGAAELARHAVRHRTVVSLGHQKALEEDLTRLVEAGATALTHLGNALPRLVPRHQNPLMAGMAEDGLQATVIGDGHHVPVSVLKCIIRAKGVPSVSVISDASPLAGMPPGHYHLYQKEIVLEESGRLYDPVGGHLVGASVTLLQCMNHVASLGFLKLEELLRLGFYNPLRLMRIAPGSVRAKGNIVFDESAAIFRE